MAKKSFKDDIGSFLEDFKKKSETTESGNTPINESSVPETKKTAKTDDGNKRLETKMERMDFELHKWRTGQLTFDLFNESLKKHKLKYLPDENRFEKMDN